MARGGFPGMGGGNMQQMVRQMQQMQQKIEKIQEEIGETEFSASTGGGAVTVVVNGKKEVKSIVLSPECVDPDDIEMLQDLILSAVNEAMRIADNTMQEEMAKVTGGLPIGF
ncbi:MAG: YbaB/EbfC family nucleoid-associated protein [Eubacteriales bacterium]|nr:YbaB/EbfC family nucleoid-associated protein [Eubacteriales bacterium]MDD7550956.1 YbaB/EbfC family nucleoid-associated protein [Clostridia bacterium]MDY5754385.1 YbaB/EbfC family nucleoid-associated protein [Eubacteriales bacterium]